VPQVFVVNTLTGVTVSMNHFLSECRTRCPFPFPFLVSPLNDKGWCQKDKWQSGQTVMKIQFCVEFIKSSLKMLSALKSRHLGIPASADLSEFIQLPWGRFPFRP